MSSTGHSPRCSYQPAPQRVLHVMNGPQGGAARTTIALIKGLADAGVESAIYCHGGPADPGAGRLGDAVNGRIAFGPLKWWNRKIRLAGWRRPLVFLKQVALTGAGRRSTAAVENFARRQEVDLIHTNTILNPEGGVAAGRLGIPHVWHVRELVGPGMPFRFWREGSAFTKRVAPNASVLVANSHVTAAALRRFVPEELICVVVNGVSDARLEKLAPSSADTEVVVGMVADVQARTKHHELFLTTASRVQNRNVRFVLFGNAPDPGQDRYTDRLRHLAETLQMRDRVTFVGPSPDPVVNMSRIDLLIHPAPNESFGRIIVEAMLAGRPVVGVASGGVGELVIHNQTGFLASEPDAQQLAAFVDELAADTVLRLRMGQAGRKRAKAEYSAEEMVSDIRKVYAAALDSQGGLTGSSR